MRVVEPDVLRQVADEIGLNRDAFEVALEELDADQHITNSRRFMQQVGASGFPALVLQIGEQWFTVPNQQFASDANGFTDWLSQMLSQHAVAEG